MRKNFSTLIDEATAQAFKATCYENRIRRVKLKIDEIATKKLIDDNLKKYK